MLRGESVVGLFLSLSPPKFHVSLCPPTWNLIAVRRVTAKRLVCKNGHSLVELPSRVTASVSKCLFVGERFFFTGARSRLALDFQTLRPIIWSSATPAQPSACVGEVFGTINDSVRFRTCLVYCRAFGRTAKSASTAMAEHGTLQDTGVCGGMVPNRFGLLVLCFSDWFFFPSEVNTKDL